tara:strand:- start:251820 stop:251921 length:102 start_codon:yes stop_codon:yes gene_type:complete
MLLTLAGAYLKMNGLIMPENAQINNAQTNAKGF